MAKKEIPFSPLLNIEPLPQSIDNEVKILSYCMHSLKQTSSFNNEHFLSIKHKAIHSCLLDYSANEDVSFDPNFLIRKIIRKFPNLEIDQPLIEEIYENQDSFDEDNMILAKTFLKDDYIKHVVNTELINDVLNVTKVATSINYNKLKKVIQRLYNNLESAESTAEVDLLNGEKIMEKYQKSIEDRLERKTQKTYGYHCLDVLHPRPASAGEITIFAGESGSGKSILVQAIEAKLLDRKTCVLKVSIEMGFENTIDRYMSLKHGFNVEDIQFKVQNERLLKLLLEKTRALPENLKYFILSTQPTVTFNTLETYIVSAKSDFFKRSVLPEDEYMVVIVDLLSMIDGFGEDAREIEKSMNILHRIAKKHKVHVIGVVQTNENSMRAHTRIFKKPEELNNFNLTLKDIKNGSAYKERARLVFILNRPIQLKKRYFPDMADIWESEPDLILVDLAKSNESAFKRVRFNYDYVQRYLITEYRESVA